MKYVALLRGINVGGKNKVAMAELKSCLELAGYANVKTFLNSGNVVFSSESFDQQEIAKHIEQLLIKYFTFDSDLIKVLVLSEEDLQQVVSGAPKNFGKEPGLYHSDVVFLIGLKPETVADHFVLNPEVDSIWQGTKVFYFRRLSDLRTKSRLNQIIGKPSYKSMTVRTWNTVVKLVALLEQAV